jgi:hypothetical protein
LQYHLDLACEDLLWLDLCLSLAIDQGNEDTLECKTNIFSLAFCFFGAFAGSTSEGACFLPEAMVQTDCKLVSLQYLAIFLQLTLVLKCLVLVRMATYNRYL